MKKFNARLPRKMSALIRVALADLIKIEKKPDYEINMGMWHELPTAPNSIVCYVCFAGATLAQRGFPKRHREMDMYKDVSPVVRRKLYALNYLRLGSVADAANELGLLRRDSSGDPAASDKLTKCQSLDMQVTHYDTNPTQFKRDMRKLANKLERNGL